MSGSKAPADSEAAELDGHRVYTLKNQNSQRCPDKSSDPADGNGNKVYQYGCIPGALSQLLQAEPALRS